MGLTIHRDLEQGSDEWLQARAGVLTASVMGQLITSKTVRPANNETARSLTAQLVAERITGYVEPTYPSRAMERGNLDEPLAREHYAEHYAPVEEIGFMVRDFDGVKIGYSPDGLVNEDGAIEIKSRDQKIQLQTVLSGDVPLANMAQLQCGLLVSGREWIDYLSWSGGMPMWRKRVEPDERWHKAILEAAQAFEMAANEMVTRYRERTDGLPQTERVDHFEEEEIRI